MLTARQLLLGVGLALFAASPALANTAMAQLSRLDGVVIVLHRFTPEPARPGLALVPGDQVQTAIGRAELTFSDGSVLHLDHHTSVTITSRERVRLADGRVSLRTTIPYTIETATGTVDVLREGVFELTASTSNRDLLVRVVEGEARIPSPGGSETITATQTAFVSGPTGRPFVTPAVQTQTDAFAYWGNSPYVDITPPPTFLPYAHPTFRQFAYLRWLRNDRHDPKREYPTPHSRRPERADGDRPRGERPPRTTTAAPRSAAPVRGAGAGAAVKRPQ